MSRSDKSFAVQSRRQRLSSSLTEMGSDLMSRSGFAPSDGGGVDPFRSVLDRAECEGFEGGLEESDLTPVRW